MREGHLTRPRHVAAADQPDIRDGVVRGATRAGRDQRRTGARKAGDAVNTRGLDGLSEGQLLSQSYPHSYFLSLMTDGWGRSVKAICAKRNREQRTGAACLPDDG